MFRFVLTFLLLMFASSAQSAQFLVLCDGWLEKAAQGCTIKLSGPIEAGDADRLLAQLRQPLPAGWQYLNLLLDSPGGDVREAFRLAELVKKAMLQTTTNRVPEKAGPDNLSDPHFRNTCVSACFLVWVAGTERSSLSSRFPQDTTPAGLGLHRPTFVSAALEGKSPAEVAQMHQEMTTRVREYLRREQVPETYVQKMLEHSSRQVYWLADEGDNFALDSRAAWFEELMIARCKYDPAYEDRIRRDHGKQLVASLRTGKQLPDPMKDPAYLRYVDWKQGQNSCEYQARLEAQSHLRVGLQPRQR